MLAHTNHRHAHGGQIRGGRHSCSSGPVCRPLATIQCSQQPIVVLASSRSSVAATTDSSASSSASPSPLQTCCTAVATALLLTTSACMDASAAMMATAEQPVLTQEQERRIKAEESKYDENLMTADLRSFMDLLSKKGSNVKAEELEGPRTKLGFRRTADGRVSLRGRDGRWYNVKADMQTPGFLLLRNVVDGTMFFLPPDDSGQLLQVDLSDDAVVAQLFASGAWYDVMDPLKYEEGGRLLPLQLSEVQFRLVTTLLQDAEEETELMNQ